VEGSRDVDLTLIGDFFALLAVEEEGAAALHQLR
jgi:hypothetical protein